MAKNVTAAAEEEKKIINLPLLDGDGDTEQSEFVSVNDKTYMIARGEDVEVPLAVYEVLMNRERMKKSFLKKMRAEQSRVEQLMRI